MAGTFNPRLLEAHLEPLRPWLDLDDVTEVVINRPHEVGVERGGGWDWNEVEALSFEWLSHLGRLIANSTNQSLDGEHPLVSAVLPGGERVQVVAPPAVTNGGFSITIRKPSATAFTLDELNRYGLFASTRASDKVIDETSAELLALRDRGEWSAFLDLAVRSKKNILISGATGSGKTTLSKALIDRIPLDERLLTIEDTRELTMDHRNVVHMIYSKGGQGRAKVGPKELLEASLRMRPDRILLQELRDGTAFFYLRNVNSGHPGSITTIHADSAELAFEQLTLLVKESEGGRDLARDDIRHLLHILVDVVVQCRKVEGRFEVSEIWFEPDMGRDAGNVTSIQRDRENPIKAMG